MVLDWYKPRRGWKYWCTWCAASKLSKQYLFSVFAKPAHSSEEVTGTIVLRDAWCRRVVESYVRIGLREPWLVFCGSDTVSAHGVTISVRSNALSVPAIEGAAIRCERILLRYLTCLRKVYLIVLPGRTSIVVIESASLVALLTRRVRDSGWCFERHVYTR